MKRKNIMSFLILLIALFGFTIEVHAGGDYNKTKKLVDSGKAVLVCEYKAPNKGDGVKIIYKFKTSDSSAQWSVWLNDNGGGWEDFSAGWGDPDNVGSYIQVFDEIDGGSWDNPFVSYKNDDGKLTSIPEDQFKCPKFARLDFTSTNEVCFGETENQCRDFDEQMQNLLPDSKTIFHEIDEYASSTVYETGNITIEEYMLHDDLFELVAEKTRKYIADKYVSKTGYDLPDFVKNYINMLNTNPDVNLINNEKYRNFQVSMKAEVDKLLEAGKLTQEDAEKHKENINKEAKEALKIRDNTMIEVPESLDDSCQGILGAQFSEYLKNIFTTIQYLGPVLVAVLTIVDFIKTSVSGEKENMKKDFKRFYKRLIYAMLLFFVPLLVNLILSITGVVTPSSCF